MAVGVAGFTLTACQKYGGQSSSQTNQGAGANVNNQSTGNSVTIQNTAFSPQNLQVKVGQEVTWTNQDQFTHTVTSDTGTFDSGNVANGKTFSFTFTKEGTFTYHCNIHTSMTGQVTVTK